MAPPTDEEKAALQQGLVAQLASTPFACMEPLEALTNGTTNFVFRGRLMKPQPDGARSVIIKHSRGYAAVNKDLPLDSTRSLYEETMLDALNSFPHASIETISTSSKSSPFEAKAPRLLWFDRDTNTEVLEDFPNAIDLKATLFASVAAQNGQHPLIKDRILARSIGEALGAWLRSFQTWTSSPEQAALRKAIAGNESMRLLKHQITYDALLRVVSRFPNVLGEDKHILEAVQAMAAKEFDKKPPLESENDNEDADWGVIHGDFWSGNILLPSEGNLRTASSQQLFIVDWEFAQYGHRAYDIGQLIGDLIERDHFRGAASSLVVLSGFVSGYGFPKNNGNNLAFRVAIHAGVQLIGCYIRRAPTGPLPGTPEQVEQAMKLGTDLVVRGWKKDTDWFKNSILAALFD